MGLGCSSLWKSPIGKFPCEIRQINKDIAEESKKRQVLRDLDCFVLDNSLRESTVGALRGHTLENKFKIYNEIKKCGIKHVIVAAFSHSPRVDDAFVKKLKDNQEDFSCFYAFSELAGPNGIKDGVVDPSVPVALDKIQTYGIRNPIFEVDLADPNIDWENRCTIDDVCKLLMQRIEWTNQHICHNPKVFVNIRDFPYAMQEFPERTLTAVEFLAKLPPKFRPVGILFEEPTGRFLPEEIGAWAKSVRRVMNSNHWTDGKLLVHVHQKWGLAEQVQLECLAVGANGVWASLCEEGAAMGHACTSVSLMNLVRMGNRKILERYNCTYLRKAAMKITEITSGAPPHPKQVVYGGRALDMVFDFQGIAGGNNGPNDFDLAEFFGESPPLRISTLASTDMIRDRLINLFGKDTQFNDDIAAQMKSVMISDLKENRKEEYMSKVGIALLFDRAGGKLTSTMRDVIEDMEMHSIRAKELVDEVRAMWDEWDLRDEVSNDNCLQFDSFYNGFMIPYFGCYRCQDTQKGLRAIDMDADGLIDWNEFLVYLKWALHEYPKIEDIDELLSVTFRKGIIPAMRDEHVQSARSLV